MDNCLIREIIIPSANTYESQKKILIYQIEINQLISIIQLLTNQLKSLTSSNYNYHVARKRYYRYPFMDIQYMLLYLFIFFAFHFLRLFINGKYYDKGVLPLSRLNLKFPTTVSYYRFNAYMYCTYVPI